MNDNSKISPPSTNSYGSETNETTLSYETMRFSYHQCLTPATIMGPRATAPEAGPRLGGTLSSRHQPPTGYARETLALAYHRTDTAQLQRKDNNTRNSSISRYKNIISRYDQSRGPATEQLFRVLPSATDPSTSSRVPRSPATPALRPFPYHEPLCIMSPNPPQQQEHTPL